MYTVEYVMVMCVYRKKKNAYVCVQMCVAVQPLRKCVSLYCISLLFAIAKTRRRSEGHE